MLLSKKTIIKIDDEESNILGHECYAAVNYPALMASPFEDGASVFPTTVIVTPSGLLRPAVFP